ncbi:MAG: PAS domain-containing protein, partial [Syntrophobacteraceae bacterium]|nr:PAS domain-containing protein [Syntrophobacteraceae bacterium]
MNERQTIDAGGLDEVRRLRDRVAELEANVSWYGGVRLRDDQHREPLRTIFENARGAMFVSDEQGRCVDVNPAACAMT